MIISGSISGNVVMGEWVGVSSMTVYVGAILVILVGLVILCKGEKAAAGGGRLLTRQMTAAAERETALGELQLREEAMQSSPQAHGDESAHASPHDRDIDPDL